MIFEPYHTVSCETKTEVTIKRSVFHAFISPCGTKSQALEFLDNIRARHSGAVHHCYAWRIGVHGLDYRMSDDGEPSGTAGKPILFALQRANLSDAVIVVARYFGGVKLGVGPLARAYADSAHGVITASEHVLVRQLTRITVFCMYEDESTVTHLLDEVEARFVATYSDAISFDVDVPVAHLNVFLEKLVSRTNARAGYLKIATEGD